MKLRSLFSWFPWPKEPSAVERLDAIEEVIAEAESKPCPNNFPHTAACACLPADSASFDPYHGPPWERKFDSDKLKGDLNDNVLAASAPDPKGPPVEKPTLGPENIDARGALHLPGGLNFDPEEFKQFRKDHPEFRQQGPSRFHTTTHNVAGVGVVGITPNGFKDPGPPQSLIDELTKKDGE